MNYLEKRILKPMISLGCDKVIVKDKTPVSFFKNNRLIEKRGILKSDQIFDLTIPALSPENRMELYEKNTTKTHYKLDDTYFTFRWILTDILSCVIELGKFDLYPKTDTIIPKVKIGDKYRYITKGEFQSWIIIGISQNFSLKFQISKNETYQENNVQIIEFLEMLRDGLLLNDND